MEAEDLRLDLGSATEGWAEVVGVWKRRLVPVWTWRLVVGKWSSYYQISRARGQHPLLFYSQTKTDNDDPRL